MRLKDLNATPKLMGSFAVMIVITLGVGYLSINSLGKSNERLEALYRDEMIGAEQASDFNKQRLLLSRDSRDAILMVRDADAVAESERQATDGLARLHSLLDDMDKTFYTSAGKEIVATLRNALPAYERAYHDLYRRLHARDAAGAAAMLKEVSRLGNALGENADRAVAMKTQHGKDSFDANATSFATTRNLVLAVSALAAALGLLLSFIIARGFAVPLGKAAAALEHLAQGDLTAYLDLDSEDEVGRLGASFNRAVKSLNETMQEVSENAEQAASSSQQLASAAEAIASGAQEQAASLEQTSASLEQITATVRQSADNAHQASQLASGSRTSAEKGQDVVSAAITAMNEINAASAKISDITSTIDEIAFQTNLLAVNAAVEAARAGEEGRGFAVVATEVRSLAQRSAGAAKEIKVLIQDSLKKVETGSVLVNKSGETLQGIVGSVKRVTDIVGEIAASTSEQSTGVEQVSTAVTQMDQVTQSNSAQTEELSATAQALSEQATRLQEMVATFTLQNPAESAGSPLRKTPRGTEKTQVGRVDIISPKNASAAGSKHRPAGRDSKPKVVRQPVVLTGSGARDESFAEF